MTSKWCKDHMITSKNVIFVRFRQVECSNKLHVLIVHFNSSFSNKNELITEFLEICIRIETIQTILLKGYVWFGFYGSYLIVLFYIWDKSEAIIRLLCYLIIFIKIYRSHKWHFLEWKSATLWTWIGNKQSAEWKTIWWNAIFHWNTKKQVDYSIFDKIKTN